MSIKEFCAAYDITEDQFYGREKIEGNLNLYSVTELIPGFNPTVGGYLDLCSVTELIPGFNPTVGGGLDLRSVTKLIPGFNPTVGKYLDLNSVTELIPGFNPTVGGSLYLGGNIKCDIKPCPAVIEWENGKYIKVDGIFTEVVSKRGNVWKVKRLNHTKVTYLVTDGKKFAHGDTLKEARESLIYKISERSTEEFKHLKLSSKLSFEEAIACYRTITGACAAGVRGFVESKGLKGKSVTVKQIIKLTEDSYGGSVFKQFFT